MSAGVQFSDIMLENVAPGLSQFRPGAIRPIGERFEISRHWIFQIGINQGLGLFIYEPVLAGVLRQFFRRSSAALQQYDLMGKSLEDYFDQHIPDSPKFGKYFTALNAVETCLLQVQMAAESLNKSVLLNLKEGKFSGTEYDFCFSIANNIKHFGERTSGHKVNSYFPAWFLSDGVTDGKNILTFDALFAVVDDLYQTAVRILDKAAKAN